MHDLETLKSGGYRAAGLTQLKLTCPLSSFPDEILELGETLEQLDLSGTGLSSLPSNLGSALPKLKIALFSDCKFTIFPKEVAACPNLETVAFRNNGMEGIPEEAFPPRLRCLVLTANRLSSLPSSIGRCTHLQQCLLAGNRLVDLPASMAQCRNLTLLRLSCNNLTTLPSWLFSLPELAFLSFASNPCASPAANGASPSSAPFGLAAIPWSSLEIQDDGQTAIPGQNPSYPALWHQSPHFAEDVDIKLFRGGGGMTSDEGAPADELTTFLAAGAHESLLTVLGRIEGHPDEDDPETHFHGGLVLQRVPEGYTPLSGGGRGGPTPPLPFPSPSPSFQAQPETGESFEQPLDAPTALAMLTGLAGAAAHLHARGIAHGDLAAHSVLASKEDAHALLAGFGAATDYGRGSVAAGREGDSYRDGIEKVEVLAFGRLVGDVLGRLGDAQGTRGGEEGEGKDERAEWIRKGLENLRERCVKPVVEERPGFEEVVEVLEGLMGWRGMMRIPDVGRN
ncbi:hypothetical protein VTK26DRAFT_8592 [Humicola hyalothermophila]